MYDVLWFVEQMDFITVAQYSNQLLHFLLFFVSQYTYWQTMMRADGLVKSCKSGDVLYVST
jgi:hypothetical protein